MIPEEIVDFFQKSGGHSLLIKGEPGSGKTTFALEILNQLKDNFEIHYVSTRVADDVLFLQFPWLKEVLNKEIKTPDTKKVTREELNKLEGLIEEGFIEERAKFEGEEAVVEVGAMLPEVEEIYDFVESVYPKKTLICVDSIDGLSEKYGIPAERILYTLQKDLVEKGGVNLIFVLESSSFANIEYLGDGVISLHHEPWDSCWKRYMFIKKLRGSPVKKSKYIYTLYGGHLNALEYDDFSLDSLDSIDLSELIKYIDSLQVNSINFVVSQEFPVELLQALILTLLHQNERDSLVIPPPTYPGDVIKNHAKKFFNRVVKIAGFSKEKADIILEGRDMLIELSSDIIGYHIGEKSLVIISVDTMADLYGNLRDLPRLIDSIKAKHRVVLLTLQGNSYLGRNLGVERTIYLERMESIPVIKDAKTLKALIPQDGGRTISLIPLM